MDTIIPSFALEIDLVGSDLQNRRLKNPEHTKQQFSRFPNLHTIVYSSASRWPYGIRIDGHGLTGGFDIYDYLVKRNLERSVIPACPKLRSVSVELRREHIDPFDMRGTSSFGANIYLERWDILDGKACRPQDELDVESNPVTAMAARKRQFYLALKGLPGVDHGYFRRMWGKKQIGKGNDPELSEGCEDDADDKEEDSYDDDDDE